MRATILAVGSELLTPLRSETNASYLTGRLLEGGVEVGQRLTVADDLKLLESAFRGAIEGADIVIATGGLGPTEDDLTREAAAAALGRRLVRDPGLLEELKARFARYGRAMAPNNAKQADLIEGARALANPRGTAPGQTIEVNGRLLVLLPGPPVEMEPMFENHVFPEIRTRASGRVLKTRVVRIAGMGESDVDAAVAPVYRTFTNPRTTILSAPGQVELHLTAEGASVEDAEVALEKLSVLLRQRLGTLIYSEDGRELHEVVAALLVERGLRLALSESCTGGLLAARLTEVPGASAFLDRGFVSYSDRSKIDVLGVDPELIQREGAVSEASARAMAQGALRSAGVDVAVAITGIAGPGGGSADKPVGLVFLAMEGVLGEKLRRCLFPGDRHRVRFQAAQGALDMLRRGLLGLSGP